MKNPRHKRHSRAVALIFLFACLTVAGQTGCVVIEWPVKQVEWAIKEIRKPSLPEAVANTASPDADVRRESLNVIAETERARGDAILIELVGAMLNGDPSKREGPDRSQLVRTAAAATLGEIGERKITVPILITAVDNRDNIPIVRQEAVRSLGKIGKGERRVVEKLLNVVRDRGEDPDVRQEAALALGQVADEEIVPDLIEIMKQEKRGELRVALGARDALQQLTGKPFGAEDPDVWSLWLEEGCNEEIVRRYVAGQLELEKLRPRRGPVAEQIPESVRRVFEGIGAELALSGKSFIDGGAKILSVPVGMGRLAAKGPRRALRGRGGPGLLAKTGGAIRRGFRAMGGGLARLFKSGEEDGLDIFYYPRRGINAVGGFFVGVGRGIGRVAAKVVPGARWVYTNVKKGVQKVGAAAGRGFRRLFPKRDELKIRTQSSR